MNTRSRFFLLVLLAVSFAFTASAGDTGTIVSNYSVAGTLLTPSGQRYGFVKGMPFVQSFIPQEGGFPTQLSVNMGIDCGRIYNIDQQGTTVMSYTITARITIDTPNARIFDQELTGLKQDNMESNCQVDFPLNNALGPVQKGQVVRVTILITSIKRFDSTKGTMVDDGNAQYAAILQDNPQWPRTSYNNFVTALRFQMKTSAITMTATPPAGGTIVWEDGTNCGAQCSQSQNKGAQHTFTAQPAAGYRFTSWNSGGPCMNQPATCSTAPSVGMTLSATFAEAVTLTVTPSSNGTVSCRSGCSITQINCGYAGGSCSTVLPKGTVVTLGASPKPGLNWQGWGGACSGITTGCTLTLNSSVTVIGHFGTGTTF